VPVSAEMVPGKRSKLQGFVKNKNDKKNHGVFFRVSRVTKKNKNPHDHS